MTLEERFWSKVDKSAGPEGCWPWKAGKFKDGYGLFNLAGKKVKAHRMAFELGKGPIPVGMDVLHDCDNHPCCNPDHLRAGTQLDNARDAVTRGRMAKGERNGWAKLTEVQVREIRELFAAGNTQTALGQRMGVTQPNISYIVHGKIWRHILPIDLMKGQ